MEQWGEEGPTGRWSKLSERVLKGRSLVCLYLLQRDFGLLWNLFSSPRTENKHRESGDWTTNPIRIKREWSSLWFFWEKESQCNYIGGVKKKKEGGYCFARYYSRVETRVAKEPIERELFPRYYIGRKKEGRKEIATNRIELSKQITRAIQRLFWEFMKLVKRTDEIHEESGKGGYTTVIYSSY